MDTLDVARVCARRWYIFLLVLGLAYYASMGLTRQRHADYTSTGNFALIYHLPTTLKPNERDPRETNPLGGGNGQLLKQSIVNDLRSASSQATLAPAGLSGTAPNTPADGSRFAVLTTKDTGTVTITTYGPSAAQTRATVDRVLGVVAGRARAMQDAVGAPANSRYSAFITLPTQTSLLPPPSKAKLLIGVMAVGLIAAAGLSLVVDQLLKRLAARRASSPTPRRRSLRRPGDPVTPDSESPDSAVDDDQPTAPTAAMRAS